jgi:hypothetical protein
VARAPSVTEQASSRGAGVEKMGGTLHIDGAVYYSGSRDELNAKIRKRDDEIDRLREAMTRAADIIKRNLGRQNEKVEDARSILVRALEQ